MNKETTYSEHFIEHLTKLVLSLVTIKMYFTTFRRCDTSLTRDHHVSSHSGQLKMEMSSGDSRLKTLSVGFLEAKDRPHHPLHRPHRLSMLRPRSNSYKAPNNLLVKILSCTPSTIIQTPDKGCVIKFK